MTLNTVSITGDLISDRPEALYEGLTSVTVKGDEDATEYFCRACNLALTEYPDKFVAEDGGAWTDECSENPPADDAEDQGTYGPHVPDVRSLSWFNGAEIEVSEDKDDVTVAIEANDVTYSLSIHRVNDPENENHGKLVLIMPYSEEPGRRENAPMTHLVNNSYRLG